MFKRFWPTQACTVPSMCSNPEKYQLREPPKCGGLPANPFASLALPLDTTLVISDACLSLFLLSLPHCIAARVMVHLLYCMILQLSCHCLGRILCHCCLGATIALLYLSIRLSPLIETLIFIDCWMPPHWMYCSVCWFWHLYSYQTISLHQHTYCDIILCRVAHLVHPTIDRTETKPRQYRQSSTLPWSV